MNEEKMITLETEDGERVDFYVLEETRINGTNYLLVTDSEEDDEEGECYILKDQSKAEDADALYEFVEDDEEMDYLYKIFAELMDDLNVELKKIRKIKIDRKDRWRYEFETTEQAAEC